MMKKYSDKSNYLLTFLLVAIVFFYLYKDELFPFTNYITLDLAVQRNFATTNFFKLGATKWAHEYYYPRFFLAPFFILYQLLGLSIGEIAYLLFFTMIFALIISGYYIYNKLGGHSIGLILVYLFVVNGDFSNVVGIFFLLLLIEKPTVLGMLILSLGYYPFVVFTLPYLAFKRENFLVILGGSLAALQSWLSKRKIFDTFNGFDPEIRGFNLPIFVIIEIAFIIYFIRILTKKGQKPRPRILLPLTNLLVALGLFLVGAHFYWIVKALILFPLFVTISAKNDLT
jgi:hypothetical protein